MKTESEALTFSKTEGSSVGLWRRKGNSADIQDSAQDWIKGSCICFKIHQACRFC